MQCQCPGFVLFAVLLISTWKKKNGVLSTFSNWAFEIKSYAKIFRNSLDIAFLCKLGISHHLMLSLSFKYTAILQLFFTLALCLFSNFMVWR